MGFKFNAFKGLLIFLMCFNFLFSNKKLKPINSSSLRNKSITANRIDKAPIIDGISDTEIWDLLKETTDFYQINPSELSEPSERTSAKVAYTDEALYVFLKSYDSKPSKIKKTLARRDSWIDGFSNNSDYVGVTIDSRDDDYNGYFFGVNASGAKIDVALSGTDEYDLSWDAVWDVAVSFDDEGWNAEFKLPFSIFQYEDSNDMEWGIEVLRYIHRLQQDISWPGKPKIVRGLILPLGRLISLNGIPNQNQLEMMPYTLVGRSGRFKLNIGLDARYGLTTNSILKATVNPDFGQVEADPSVVNLTAFETFYDEKRTFFSEGSDFFNQRINLFNSRRIGKTPNFDIPEEGELEKIPDFTTILGATKIMGTLKSGINYGVIGALTSEEKAALVESGIKKNHIVEPQSSYAIGRVEAPIINNTSRLGFMGTNVARKDTTGAIVFGVDWNLGFFENKLFSNGQVIKTKSNNISGNALRFNLGYLNPVWWSFRFWYGDLDDSFEINDLGYSRRNNISWTGIMLDVRNQFSRGIFINNNIKIIYNTAQNGQGIILERELEVKQNNLLKNYWKISFGAGIDLKAYNDDDLYIDEDAWIYESEEMRRFGFNLQTDRRKRIVLSTGGGVGYGRNRGFGYRKEMGVVLKPFESLNIEAELVEDFSPSAMQYVDVVKNEIDTARVYAESNLLTQDISFRLNWTFNPEMTLECYIQPFYAEMNYKKFSRLINPESVNLEDYSYLKDNENPNFRYSNTIGTFVFRWEYRSGSTIYLVYNLNQENSYSFTDSKWSLSNKNAIYFKINYWFKY